MATTVAPIMVNGPLRKTLDINCDAGVFGPGYRSNATIGRAIRLILITVGGGFPGDTDRSTFGWPGKYTMCFGENQEKSPWEPYHVEMGFKPEESTVTVCGINGFLPMHTAGNRGEQALSSLAEVIAMHHGVSHLDVGSFGGGTPMVALGTEDAEIMPYPSLRGVETVLGLVEKDNPRAKGADPKSFVDDSLLREIDASGFVKGLYQR